MNIQTIIVFIIVFLCILYIGKHLFSFWKNMKDNKNPCQNCTTQCELKKMIETKKKECTALKKKNKKKCCG